MDVNALDPRKIKLLNAEQEEQARDMAQRRIAGRHPDTLRALVQTPAPPPVQAEPLEPRIEVDAPAQEVALTIPDAPQPQAKRGVVSAVRAWLSPDLHDDMTSAFPPLLRMWVRRFLLIVIFSGAVSSSIRVFIAAYDEFNPIQRVGVSTHAVNILAHTPPFDLNTIIAPVVAAIAAAFTIMTAEAGQTIFTLAYAMAMTFSQKAAAVLATTICTLVAFFANFHVGRPDLHAGVWPWVGTVAPPLIVLLGGFVLKTDVMHALTERRKKQMDAIKEAHAREQAERLAREEAVRAAREAQERKEREAHEEREKYEAAVRAWEAAYAQAPESGRWDMVYAMCIWEALKRKNPTIATAMEQLPNPTKYAIYQNQLRVNDWTIAPAVTVGVAMDERSALDAPPMRALPTSRRTPASAGRNTGEFANAATQDERGKWTGKCPDCGRVFNRGGEGYDTEDDVKKALSAHKRTHLREVSKS